MYVRGCIHIFLGLVHYFMLISLAYSHQHLYKATYKENDAFNLLYEGSLNNTVRVLIAYYHLCIQSNGIYTIGANDTSPP